MSSEASRSIVLRSGNQMVADGALRAGCRFFAGYPITPATGIFKAMIDALPSRKGLALSAPDEISAIAYCIGAAMRGYKAMTATSGPGWALMIESVQYALMTETPLVVALVQRLGPSTGGATQGAQGDILLAEYATSGGYTIPILCPETAQECASLTLKAFEWAEQLRTPVIVLSDKETGMTIESVDLGLLPAESDVSTFAVPDGADLSKGTYWFDQPADIPAFAPVGGDERVIATGSAHDKKGTLQKNSSETLDVLRHLEEKIRWRAGDMEVVDADPDPEADTLVISYGITARAARTAVAKARAQGQRVAFMSIKSLFPVPTYALEEAFATADRVIVAEENMNGLYRSVIERVADGHTMVGVNSIGTMITPSEILAAIQR
ncbi:MAG: pyruvate flavodoxin/ferredoxin oxidoreductase [Bacteroidetes bacterium]|jgi:2-oxoglutarate ferredoxin oxidoreductase subunit alpha|nr:pyruvate flavodoxin/ferredoxin oxidoreductase [Bacteroidota bacterium]